MLMLNLRQYRRVLECFVLLAAVAVAPAVVLGQERTLEGHWEGKIEIPGQPLEVTLQFTLAEDGTWQGTISIPAQNARDLPLANIEMRGEQVSFAIAGVPGDPTFAGVLTQEGTISGDFTQAGQTFPFSLVAADDPVARAQAALEGLDAVVEQALEDFKVPGLGLAIVVSGEVVMAKGYGQRDIERGLPVTDQTLFAIGSCTKAFTTFLLGMLVDEGTLDWDTPVIEYLPEFRLYDDHATKALTVRDLVTHRSGLPRHDLLWYNADYTRSELVERLRYLQPFADLRERYHYQNLMYLTAGYLAEQVTGRAWEELVRERILDPLGMAGSNFSVEASKRTADFAQPYRKVEEELRLIPFRNIDVIGPAGSINSSVTEMSHWLMVQLNHGKFGEQQLLQASTAREMHTPVTLMSGYPTEPQILFSAYGLGWVLQAYRGHYRAVHGGGIDGFTAMVSLLPEDGIGVVALSNRSGAPVPELISRHVIDRLLELEPKDWLGEALERLRRVEESEEGAEERLEETRVAGTQPAHPLEAYVGEYEHPGYGIVKVEGDGRQLALTYNDISAPLEHWHYEVFNALENPDDPALENTKIVFRTDVKGHVASVVIPMDLEVDVIVFTKKPDARLFDPDYLARFTGVYQLPNVEVTVDLKGSVLTASIPGQPVYELVPLRGTEFALKGLAGFSAVFVVDPEGQVTELQFHQPNGVFTAPRKQE